MIVKFHAAWFLLLLSFSLAGCTNSKANPGTPIATTPTPPPTPTSLPTSPPTPPSTNRPPLTVPKLKNTEYYVLAEGPVKLTDGKATDQKQRSFTLGEVIAYGDVNKDGIKDAIAPLTITIDGRNFVYLATLINENGNPKNTATQFLGGDVTVTNLTIDAGKIIVNMTQPGVTITRTYELRSFKPTASPSPSAKPASPSPKPSP
jgi:hypothetical protein